MLALLGATTIAVLLALILLNRCSPLVALIVVPAAAGLLGGFGRKTAEFMVEGHHGYCAGRGDVRFCHRLFWGHDGCRGCLIRSSPAS